MPKIRYLPAKLAGAKLAMVKQANAIIAEYAAAGFDLTLRQLYYQFVARGLMENRQQNYKRLGDIMNDARLQGYVDWEAIVDRTRYVREHAAWGGPADIIEACASQFDVNHWHGQPVAVEVWIEKDALVGVIEPVCKEWSAPYFSCRGYTSQSELWGAAQRMRARKKQHSQDTIILHFGDHDPSGVDMTRDIQDRLTMFGAPADVRRIALTMAQVEQFNPPPNPAKLTDSRATAYIREHGDESWELDALDPVTLAGLIRAQIEGEIDEGAWAETHRARDKGRAELTLISENYADVVERLEAD